MQIILLSGGSGKRLWPLSNESRSKQFLKVLTAPDGHKESMVQRVLRQISEAGIKGDVTVATSLSQKDIIGNQLGKDIAIVTEPERRDTFPAIALATAFLALEKGCADDEIVIVMPCDPYTGAGYFDAIHAMEAAVTEDLADLVLMGIQPTYPSAKYGYVVPAHPAENGCVTPVSRFTEKPDVPAAERLLAEGALWNGGVFAFRLGYMRAIVSRYSQATSFAEVRAHYADFPKISFDYEVAEKAESVAVIPFGGEWKDLGTWNTLTDELDIPSTGNTVMDETCENTHIINELELPILCVGIKDAIIAASYDGILISEKKQSEKIKDYVNHLERRPMYEERRWGEYKVIDLTEFPDGYKSLTKQLVIHEGKSISYQLHHHRDEVWTFIDGEGLLVLDGEITKIKRGDTVRIKAGVRHAVKAVSELRFIEVQSGDALSEEDIERFDWEW